MLCAYASSLWTELAYNSRSWGIDIEVGSANKLLFVVKRLSRFVLSILQRRTDALDLGLSSKNDEAESGSAGWGIPVNRISRDYITTSFYLLIRLKY